MEQKTNAAPNGPLADLAQDCVSRLLKTVVTKTIREMGLPNERPCCGTFEGSPHRATCWKYKGKFKR